MLGREPRLPLRDWSNFVLAPRPERAANFVVARVVVEIELVVTVVAVKSINL